MRNHDDSSSHQLVAQRLPFLAHFALASKPKVLVQETLSLAIAPPLGEPFRLHIAREAPVSELKRRIACRAGMPAAVLQRLAHHCEVMMMMMMLPPRRRFRPPHGRQLHRLGGRRVLSGSSISTSSELIFHFSNSLPRAF